MNSFQEHMEEMENRNQYVYILDRKKSNDQTLHTYYQVYKKIIYVVQLRVEHNKCIATIQVRCSI